MVTIINYGMGNLRSVKNMISYLGYNSEITDSPEKIATAEKLILPGVGHFGYAMENIAKLNIRKSMDYAILEKKKPVLGICLGMQLLTSHSEEGDCEGLKYVPGSTVKFKYEELNGEKIPHMGWDYINIKDNIPFMEEVKDNYRFYFVHSYYVKCSDAKNQVATTTYGLEFDSIIQNGNILGTQFHPEKSHKFGMQLMKNFLEKY